MVELLPSRYIRTAFGLVLGCVIGTLAYITVLGGLDILLRGGHLSDWLGAQSLRITCVFIIMSLILGVLPGILIHALLYTRDMRALIYYLGSGFLGGALIRLAISANLQASLFEIAQFGLWAAMIASIFWLIRRPDLDNRSPGVKPVTPTTPP